MGLKEKLGTLEDKARENKLASKAMVVVDEIRENEKDPEKMKLKEYISFALGRLSFGSIRHLSAGYRQEFYMSAGLEPARAGQLVFAQTMFDAIADPIVGSMVDSRKNTQNGRFKPFIAPLVIPLAMLSVLMFSLPGFVGVGRAFIWFFASYALWEIVNTAAGTSFDAIATIMSGDKRERTLYTTIGAIGHQLSGMIPGFIPAVMELIAIDRVTNEPRISQATFFLMTAILFGLLGISTGLFTKNLKERIVPKIKTQNYFENIRMFFQNKNLLLLWTTDIPQLISSAAGPTSAHFYIHVVGNRIIQSIQWTLAGIPHFLAHTLAPFFLKRFRPSRIIIACTMANGVSFLLLFLIGRMTGFTTWYGVAVLLIFTSVGWIPAGIAGIARQMLQMNTFDYMAAKTGKRAEATSLAAFNAGSKMLWAFAALLGGYALQYIGFQQDIGGVMQTQTPETLQGLFTIFALFPAVGNLLGALPLFFFKLEGAEFDRRMAELGAVQKEKETIEH
ncbi:MAG: MFS transporter [Oscillospiraceae bacterium]|nr:MFS transporter [Oscillospiraceae bacterium]